MTVIGNLGDAPGPQDAGSRRLPPLEIAALNAFSARCAAYVLNKHPEWAPFASSEGDILFLDIPSPVPGRSLWMTTYADEVTIGLTPGMWHEHFNAASLECTDEALFASAMVWIDEIVAEEVLIVETQTQEHETRTWTTVRRDCKITPPPRGRKIVLSSWGGPMIAKSDRVGFAGSEHLGQERQSSRLGRGVLQLGKVKGRNVRPLIDFTVD